jgi:hypothetical protein
MHTVDQLSYTELLQIFIFIKNTCKKLSRQEQMQRERREPRGLAAGKLKKSLHKIKATIAEKACCQIHSSHPAPRRRSTRTRRCLHGTQQLARDRRRRLTTRGHTCPEAPLPGKSCGTRRRLLALDDHCHQQQPPPHPRPRRRSSSRPAAGTWTT